MIKIEDVYISGWEAAIRGMRNPLNSWNRPDTEHRKAIDRHANDAPENFEEINEEVPF